MRVELEKTRTPSGPAGRRGDGTLEEDALAALYKQAPARPAHLVFLDESGFLLIPTVAKTWVQVGTTPLLWHSYKRDRISAMSGVTVSPTRRRRGLYIQFHTTNLTGQEVLAFLRHLQRHWRGNVGLLWAGGSIHRRNDVQAFLAQQKRLWVHRFPGYALQLNPDEFVRTKAQHDLSTSTPKDIHELGTKRRRSIRRIKRSQRLLWSCIEASDLPWT